ncbi:MAG: hypothetical protein IPN50_03405 [Sphingomonadales bacterium]|nr:hypothetical protein [Sphingomonadales bacterium]
MPAPENFSDRVKAIRAASGDVTDELRALAGHALNANQLLRLGKLVDKAAALQPFKLGIISNATTDF